MNEQEIDSVLAQFDAAMLQLESIVVRLREVTGTIGLLVMALRAIAKKSDFDYRTGMPPKP